MQPDRKGLLNCHCCADTDVCRLSQRRYPEIPVVLGHRSACSFLRSIVTALPRSLASNSNYWSLVAANREGACPCAIITTTCSIALHNSCSLGRRCELLEMVRKRSLSDADAGDIMLMDTNNTFDQQQQQHSQSSSGQQQKRCCGTGRHPAPGELKADQVMTYLHSLSAHLTNGQLQYASTVLSAEGWQVDGNCTFSVLQRQCQWLRREHSV